MNSTRGMCVSPPASNSSRRGEVAPSTDIVQPSQPPHESQMTQARSSGPTCPPSSGTSSRTMKPSSPVRTPPSPPRCPPRGSWSGSVGIRRVFRELALGHGPSEAPHMIRHEPVLPLERVGPNGELPLPFGGELVHPPGRAGGWRLPARANQIGPLQLTENPIEPPGLTDGHAERLQFLQKGIPMGLAASQEQQDGRFHGLPWKLHGPLAHLASLVLSVWLLLVHL